MEFCRNGTTWEDITDANGDDVSRCFFESTSSVSLLLYICVWWLALLVHSRFRSPYENIEQPRERFKSRIHVAQGVLVSILIFLSVFYNVRHAWLNNHLGFQVMETVAVIVAYLLTVTLTFHDKLQCCRLRLSPRGVEVGHLSFWCLSLLRKSIPFVWMNNPTWWWPVITWEDAIDLCMFTLSYVLGVCLSALSIASLCVKSCDQPREGDTHHTTWKGFFGKVKKMLPYAWPRSLKLRSFVLCCLILVLAGRGLTVLIPKWSKKIVNSLDSTISGTPSHPDTPQLRWDLICEYALFYFLKGGGAGNTGLLNHMRSILWTRVEQHNTVGLQIDLFRHLHRLSIKDHPDRKIGYVRAIDRGAKALDTLLTHTLFDIIPILVDIVVAVLYFVGNLEFIFAIIMSISIIFYLTATFIAAEWRTSYRRQMNTENDLAHSRATDSLLNFETVKYLNTLEWEEERYVSSVEKYESATWKSKVSLNILNVIQNIVHTGCLTAGSLLCAWAVVYHSSIEEKMTVGDYVMYGAYLHQLYVPLDWLGTHYREIQQAFIDMENMFDLLSQDVQDESNKDADFPVDFQGKIEFENVSFEFDSGKEVLKDVSFTVKPGQMCAIVGDNGSGKSTVAKLLMGLYSIQRGSIKIDDQDLSRLSKTSLFRHIGVIPQDAVMFNGDIRYNIRYDRPPGADLGEYVSWAGYSGRDADADMIGAARAAHIHDTIAALPNKYEEPVGERGMKLSSGERQKIVIARALLRNPDVLLVDDALSSLDVGTARCILDNICGGRTTIIISHRLSSIIRADNILVLDRGRVVEQGTHQQLLQRRQGQGHYARMWEMEHGSGVCSNKCQPGRHF